MKEFYSTFLTYFSARNVLLAGTLYNLKIYEHDTTQDSGYIVLTPTRSFCHSFQAKYADISRTHSVTFTQNLGWPSTLLSHPNLNATFFHVFLAFKTRLLAIYNSIKFSFLLIFSIIKWVVTIGSWVAWPFNLAVVNRRRNENLVQHGWC